MAQVFQRNICSTSTGLGFLISRFLVLLDKSLNVLDDAGDVLMVFHHFLMVAATLVGRTCFDCFAHLDIDFYCFSLNAIRVEKMSLLY